MSNSTSSLLMESPVGPLRLTCKGGALTEVAFVDSADVDGAGAGADARSNPSAVLVETRRQLDAYFAGELRAFDLPLAAGGTPFRRRVWTELTAIPYGATASYGQIAARLGMSPGGSRAVGLANGANPLAIVVPCHRVVGANGSLTGYAGGLDRKRFLLGLEAPAVEGGLFAASSG